MLGLLCKNSTFQSFLFLSASQNAVWFILRLSTLPIIHLLLYLNWAQNQTTKSCWRLGAFLHVPVLAKANHFRGGGIKSPVHFTRFMFDQKRKPFFFFFFLVNASLFPPPAPLINKRKGKPSLGFIDAFSLAWILLCGKEQKEGKAAGLICSFKKDKNSGFGNQSAVTSAPHAAQRFMSFVTPISAVFRALLHLVRALTYSLHHINQRLHAINPLGPNASLQN